MQQQPDHVLFVTTENGDRQDICNMITMLCVQQSLYLNEVTNNFGSIKNEVPRGVDSRTRDVLEHCTTTCGKVAGSRAKMRYRARKETSAQEVQGYFKQFAEAKHLDCKSWFDNEVFDLNDMRKVKPKFMLLDDGYSSSRRTNKVTFSRQRPHGY